MRTRQHLLSEQAVQLPLAVLQPTSVSAIHHPNQPVGLPNKKNRRQEGVQTICKMYGSKLFSLYATAAVAVESMPEGDTRGYSRNTDRTGMAAERGYRGHES